MNCKNNGKLLTKLRGATPISKDGQEKSGWGLRASEYIVKQGYETRIEWKTNLDPKIYDMENDMENIKSSKIKFFCWTLSHRKNLTTKNLHK